MTLPSLIASLDPLAYWPLEPGDVRLEEQERERERDEAETPVERFADDAGWWDA